MTRATSTSAILTILLGLFLLFSLKLATLIPFTSRPPFLDAVTFAAALVSPFVILWGTAQLISVTFQRNKLQKKATIIFGQATGLFLLVVFLCVFNNRSPGPKFVVEGLPAEQWGFGSLPPGTEYYVQPNVTCVVAYGDSYRLGVVRVVTNIHYTGMLSIPPPKLPPAGK